MSVNSAQGESLQEASNVPETREHRPSLYANVPGEIHLHIIHTITESIGASKEASALAGTCKRFQGLYKRPLVIGRYVDDQWSLLLHGIVLSRSGKKVDPETLKEVDDKALQNLRDAESYHQWRNVDPKGSKGSTLTPGQLHFRKLLLGEPKSGGDKHQGNSEPFPNEASRPINTLPKELNNYSDSSSLQRYRIIVLLLTRHFAPAHSAYHNQTKELWLETAAFLFKELRAIVKKAEIKPEQLHHDLKYFANPPTSVDFDMKKAQEYVERRNRIGTQLAHSGSNRPLTVIQLALGCHKVNPADAALCAWKHYYQKDRDLLLPEIYNFENFPSRLVDWNYYQLYNTRNGLPRLLKLFFNELLPLGESATHQGGLETDGGEVAKKPEISRATAEIRWKALQEMVYFRYPDHELYNGIKDSSNLFLQFPHKEEAFKDAMGVLLADDGWCRSLRDCKRLDWLFKRMFFQRTRDFLQVGKIWYEFMGGERHLLPLLLDKFHESPSEIATKLHTLQKGGRCFLHNLLAYRAPETIRKLLELGLKDHINYKHEDYFNCPPLTYIMRQAVRDRDRLHWSFRFDLICQSIQIMIEYGADPWLVDESQDVKACKLNAIMYASLDSRLKPLLKALLWDNGGKIQVPSRYQSLGENDSDCSTFLKNNGCPISKAEILDLLEKDPKNKLPELRKYNSEDFLGLEYCAGSPDTEYVRREDDVEFDIEQRHKHFPGELELSPLLDDPILPLDRNDTISEPISFNSPPDLPLSLSNNGMMMHAPQIPGFTTEPRYSFKQLLKMSRDPEICDRLVAFGSNSTRYF